MYVVGVGLVKVFKPFIRLASGGILCPPSDVCVRSFLCPFLYFNKTLLHKALEWSRLVPNLKAKSSSEITNLILFTVSYQLSVSSDSCPLSWWCHSTILSSLSPFTPAFNLSQHQGLLQWVNSSYQMAKLSEFQLQYQSFQWIFRVDFL